MATRGDLVNFTFEVVGEKQLNTALLLLDKNISDMTALWPDVDEYLRDAEKEQFSSEGARGAGHKWVKLSEPYRLWKERTHPGKPILELKGPLKESLTQSGGRHIFKAERMGMGFGTTVPYGLYHQTGTAHMPKREPIRLLKKEDAVKIAKLMQEFIFKSGQGYQRTLI